MDHDSHSENHSQGGEIQHALGKKETDVKDEMGGGKERHGVEQRSRKQGQPEPWTGSSSSSRRGGGGGERSGTITTSKGALDVTDKRGEEVD